MARPVMFQVLHHGECDALGLGSELERFANDQWIGDHYSLPQCEVLVMDRFRRKVLQELELLELRARIEPDCAKSD